jgi:hypothetical protein
MSTPEQRKKRATYKREYLKTHPEYKQKQANREHSRYANNPEYRKKMCARTQNRRATNPEYRQKCNAYRPQRHKRHPGVARAYVALRRARLIRATPKWLTKAQLKQMRQFYIDCPAGYHVDHIYPLKGKNSCGLHVPWNLQYLPAKENLKKGNHLP